MAAALESAVEALRSRPAPTPPPPPAPDAAAVMARLTGALRDHDTRFLDDYLLVLVSHNDAEVKAITDELMHSIESALVAGEGGGTDAIGAGGVVLASWLAAAAAWRAPRVPAAPRALLCLLRDLTPQQVAEVARALHDSLEARALVVASDALRSAEARGAGGARAWALAGESEGDKQGGLAALLLRAALAKLLCADVEWRAPFHALTVEEVCSMLAPRWETLGAEAQLIGAGVAARVVAGAAARGAQGAGPPAARLLDALAHPPPPALRHHPDYLKATVALSKLQRLFKPESVARTKPQTDSTALANDT